MLLPKDFCSIVYIITPLLRYRSPHNPDLTITKRIIALEGDTVRPLPQSEQKSGNWNEKQGFTHFLSLGNDNI